MSLSADTTLYVLYNSLFKQKYGPASWGTATKSQKPICVVINNIGEASKFTMDGNEIETELFQLTVHGDPSISRTEVIQASEEIREALTNQVNLEPDSDELGAVGSPINDPYPYKILAVTRDHTLTQLQDDNKSWSAASTYRVISQRT
jgi:hypothetical protein